MTTFVLGAGGVIGGFIATDLVGRGLPVIAVARRFTPARARSIRSRPRAKYRSRELDIAALTRVLEESAADVVVNCLGVVAGQCGRQRA